MISSLKDFSYEERLHVLNLTTLETRRVRGDLIEVFKIIKGYEDVSFDKFFQLSSTCTRGHSLKLFKQGTHLDCRKYVFSQRIVNIWNSLSEDVIACDSINVFKSRIDKFLKGQGFI